jgi:hypothetical protein
LVYSLFLPSSVFGVVHEESGAEFDLPCCFATAALELRPGRFKRARRMLESSLEQTAEDGSPEKS